ncbi:hypothetical protein [Streptomyces sp. NPDC048361]|uniref:hypothetical protein n=1 Tax=Streptomyces sp. NPDC048361 TaxID=3154720 RepID=UPI00343C60F9
MLTHHHPEAALSGQVTDVALFQLPLGTPLSIASLGPEGTSSEQASRALLGHLGQRGHEHVRIDLFDQYEAAGASLLSGDSSLVVVANAYARIEQFYMNPALRLAAVFVKDTPNYGIAGLPGSDRDAKVAVATHPAPRALVEELLPAEYTLTETVFVDSTSAAAEAVVAGEVPLALTTMPAARLRGLEFVSRTRPIRMVWSVFTRAELLDDRRLAPGRLLANTANPSW